MKRIRLESIFILVALCAILLLPGKTHASTRVEEDITTPITWTEAGSPYIISKHIIVLPDAKLTLEAGTIIKFDTQGALSVLGGFESLGTQQKLVYITSLKNDLVGGDSNEDVDATTPQNGDWSELYFETSQVINMTYTNISYGNSTIVANGTTINLAHVTCYHDVSCGTFYNKSNVQADSMRGLFLSQEVMTIYKESSAVITNGYFEIFYPLIGDEIKDSAFTVFNDSSLVLINPTINGFQKKQGFVDVFNKSIASIDKGQVDFKGGKDMMTIFNDSQLLIKNVSFSGGTGTGITLFNHAELTLENSTVNNFTKYAIDAFGSNSPYKPNVLSLNNVILSKNDIGLRLTSDITYTGKNVQIVNNTSYGAYLSGDGTIMLPSIWWGSETGPYNAASNPTGTGNPISDGVIASPYTSLNPEIPKSYYAKITNIPNSVANLYDTPTTKSILVKTVPDDWIVKVLSTLDSNDQPMVSDGYHWYKVEDPTDNTTHYMISGTGTTPIYLPYEKEKQKEYEDTSIDNLSGNLKINDRVNVISQAIENYFNNTNTGKSLYSSDDQDTKISNLSKQNFPTDLIRAIVAVEIGGEKFDNENVSYDYGHGIMQVTMDAYAHENPNMKNYGIKYNNNDPRGFTSSINLKLCKEKNSDQYKKCYINTESFNTKIKTYDNYDHNILNPIYKQYANTKQSIYANIKDGLAVLETKEGRVFAKPCTKDWIAGPYTFSCSDINIIKAVWGYNGAVLDKDIKYLKAVSNRLANLKKYFPDTNYINKDKLIEKLVYANDHRIELKAHSPIEIRMKDSKGNTTGFVSNNEVANIPNSDYDSESEQAVIFFPTDTYTYEVVGDETVPSGGSYGLDINIFNESDTPLIFNAVDLPITTGEIHTYKVDQVKLANNQPDAVTVQIDANGDGIVERTIETGRILSSTTPYDFYFPKPRLGEYKYQSNQIIPINIIVTREDKQSIPLQHPVLEITRVSDGYKPKISKIIMKEDNSCLSGSSRICLIKKHSQYSAQLQAYSLKPGQWKVEVNLDSGIKHSIIINVVK